MENEISMFVLAFFGAFPGYEEWQKGVEYERQADLLKSSRTECF